jgi:hypothetical protein
MKQSGPENGAGTYPAAAPDADGLRLLLTEREETIRDLRHRLDLASEDLRREAEERRRLTALLMHRQPGSVPAVASAEPRPTSGGGGGSGDQRRSPVTTKSIRRLPHWPQTSRACQAGTVISAP